MNQIFKLYANCIPVSGYQRSIICDLQRKNFEFIPNSLYQILVTYDNMIIDEIASSYDYKFKSHIEEYFEFLIKEEFVFIIDKNEVSFFPTLQKCWETPSEIGNSIIDMTFFDNDTLNDLFFKLEELGCRHYLLFSNTDKSICFFENLVKTFEKYRVQSVEIIIAYDEKYNLDFYDYINKLSYITKCIIFNAPFQKNIGNKIIATTESLSLSNTNTIHPNFFTIEILYFLEALWYNTNCNKKIFINQDGNVLNTCGAKKIFGNIYSEDITKVIFESDYKEIWDIKKDIIDICRDCEFRYICFDQRMPTKDIANNWFYEAQCPYNPYIAKWQNEEGWISVEQWRTENPGWEVQAIELRELNKKYIGANE